MRVLGSILIASIALGCTHSPTTAQMPVAVENNNNVIYLKKGDRDPASAPQLLWQPGAVRIAVGSSNASGNANVDVNQEMIWKEMESFQDYRNEYREYEVPGQCSDFVCTAAPVKSPAWDAYFAASRDRKAAALANAIQGIGNASAEALVARKYFPVMPKSWSAFAQEINRAADAGVIKKSVATTVLNNYKYENFTNLGYGRESCREEVRQCTYVISKLVQVPFMNQREVERRRVVATKSFSVAISVSDAVLMATEKDVVTLKINENGQVTDVDTSGYNRYALVSQSVDGQKVTVALKSASRVLRDLPNNVVRQDAYQLVNDKPYLVLDVDPAYIPGADDPNSQLVIDYTVRTCKYGWTGLCGIGWDKTLMSSAPITAARSTLPMIVAPQHKSDVVYTISRKNSRFFNDKGTSERSTETVKMPK